ncbi:hypothetical protein D3C87_858660 [compost metagenome]
MNYNEGTIRYLENAQREIIENDQKLLNSMLYIKNIQDIDEMEDYIEDLLEDKYISSDVALRAFNEIVKPNIRELKMYEGVIERLYRNVYNKDALNETLFGIVAERNRSRKEQRLLRRTMPSLVVSSESLLGTYRIFE